MSDAPTDPDVTARLLRTRLAAGPLDLPVAGSSMRGVIDSGSTVEVHAGSAPRVGEIWAFTADDGTIVVHRVRHVAADTIVCRGTGNRFDDEPVGHQRLVGTVVSVTTPAGTRRFGGRDRLLAAVEFRIRATLRRLRRTLSGR